MDMGGGSGENKEKLRVFLDIATRGMDGRGARPQWFWMGGWGKDDSALQARAGAPLPQRGGRKGG